MRAVLLLASCAALSGCFGVSGPDCRDETRSLAASTRLTSISSPVQPSDTGTAYISLYEARDFTTKTTAAREVLWFVGSNLSRAGVTAVHVHEQTTGKLLFNVPLDSSQGPAYVITQVFTRRPYSGPADWNELYDLIGSERAYVDVHTNNFPNGQLRGTLRPDYPNWQSFTHAYCS